MLMGVDEKLEITFLKCKLTQMCKSVRTEMVTGILLCKENR